MAMTVGPVRAREMLLTARLVDATEAKAIGLVDHVYPASDLEARVTELASRLSELASRLSELAPLTLAAIKEATRRVTAPAAVRDAEDIILSCYLSHDVQEGVRAFLDKRKPDWQGR